ncbi:hypothetical protein QE152_g37032 [Popillia japonica]|uniref:Reverse transcriptase n=1 Tax=Popillia japonica TaxID=7064 RepID=A0AAW1IBS9_POPJA
MERWYRYFKTTLNGKEEQEAETVQSELEDKNQTDDITMLDVEDALQKLKNGKAAGEDLIKALQIKYMSWKGKEMIHRINVPWRTSNIPREWTLAVILPIHKKGESSKCSNYRPISLLNVCNSEYEIVLEKRYIGARF